MRNLPPEKRIKKMASAVEKYSNGTIDLEQFQQEEDQYSFDYGETKHLAPPPKNYKEIISSWFTR